MSSTQTQPDKTLLVIDDDLDTRAALFDMLEDGGYCVVTARNGLEAIELLRGGLRPDAILVDYYMPLMSGEAFCGECDADPRFAPIPRVLCSGNRDARARTDRCRARAFIEKPVKPDEVFGVLGDLVAHPS